MSLYENVITKKPKFKSLPKSTINKTIILFPSKGIPFSATLKASYTLEAAVIFPLVAGFIVALLMFFRVMQIEEAVQESLSYTGRMVAVENSINEDKLISLSLAEGLFRKELLGNELISEHVKGGNLGISLSNSDFGEELICLRAGYKVKLPVSFFSIDGIDINQETCNRKWTGKTVADGENDPYVYYTEYGKVYHLTTSCKYLDLSIRGVSLMEVKNLRNLEGAKYYECHLCSKMGGNGIVYITDYGTLYHGSIECSRLKRTIYKVHLSEVGDRRLCSKCQEN